MVVGLRWRRDGWLVGSVILAVLIVGTAAVVGSPRTGGPAAVPDGSSPTGPQTLPDDPFGRAVVVYAACARCRPLVQLADGREFAVPTDASDVSAVTLSPDGRWLGYPVGTGFALRDLTRSDEFRIGSPSVDRRISAWAWSADSSVLLLGDHRDGEVTSFVLLWMGDGVRTTIPASPGHEVLGVRATAELVVARPDARPGPQVVLGVSTPIGPVEHWSTVDLAPHLRPGERLLPNSVRLSGAGDGLTAVVADAADEPVALLRLTLAGWLVLRYDLADPGPGQWVVLGEGPDGTVVAHVSAESTTLWYLRPDGGFVDGRELPGGATVRPPGVARY